MYYEEEVWFSIMETRAPCSNSSRLTPRLVRFPVSAAYGNTLRAVASLGSAMRCCLRDTTGYQAWGVVGIDDDDGLHVRECCHDPLAFVSTKRAVPDHGRAGEDEEEGRFAAAFAGCTLCYCRPSSPSGGASSRLPKVPASQVRRWSTRPVHRKSNRRASQYGSEATPSLWVAAELA
ncbi:hypothetical protein PWT90_10634 [Aphanocladium album]|nr:hypothetical protein PWT90_10634 [Aphanocladium album]